MLTEEEKRFVEYWEANRLRQKKVSRQLSLGLPLSSLLVVAIFINFFSGWYKRADMEIRSTDPSLILVLVIAGVLIVVFTTVFSVRHKWDMNEQYYNELLAKKDKP
jgi:membrane-associated HD superfamily phosphohydrolase